MILEWASIVGSGLAFETLPVKLSFARGERADGTLHLRVASGAAPMVQHLEPMILERINGFFGYRAVSRLAIRQGPLPPRRKPAAARPSRPLTAGESERLTAATEAIADPDLRAAIERLGRAVLGAAPVPSPVARPTDSR